MLPAIEARSIVNGGGGPKSRTYFRQGSAGEIIAGMYEIVRLHWII